MASISALGVGSGLDLSGLLDQLRDAERGKLAPLTAQKTQQQAKISAYGQLQSALTTFQDSVAKLNEASLYQSLSANVRGDAFSATTSKSAQPGTYNVEVSQLATAGTLATTAITTPRDKPFFTDSNTLTLKFGAVYGEDGELVEPRDGELVEPRDGELVEPREVRITIEKDWSLEDLRDAINANEEAGVMASIINDGSGDRLALASKETGAKASLVGLDFEKNTVLAEDSDTLRAGQDANLTVNGIAITSPSNSVEGAIQGVTLNLEETTDGQPATLRIEQDTLKVREAVQDFVKAFNDLKGTIGTLTAYNAETGLAGELNGDSTVRTIESRLRSALSGGVAEGELRMLNQVGISLQRDGTLELDDDQLNALVRDDMAALGEFFAGADSKGGLAGSLTTTLDQLLGGEGVVKRSINGAETRIKSLNERYERMEVSIERNIQRYRAQFSQLDVMVAQMNSMSDYLGQQFEMMNAQLGRD